VGLAGGGNMNQALYTYIFIYENRIVKPVKNCSMRGRQIRVTEG
jgi:hypothetical protein